MSGYVATRLGLVAMQSMLLNSAAFQLRLYQLVIACASHTSANSKTAIKKDLHVWNRGDPRQYCGVDNWTREKVFDFKASQKIPIKPAMAPYTTITDAIDVPKFAFISKFRFLMASRSLLGTVLQNAAASTGSRFDKEEPQEKSRYTGDCTFCKGPNPIEGLHRAGNSSSADSAKKCAAGKGNCFLCCNRNRA